MELRSLRYFVEVARQKSFSRAAKKLFITQPTLSRQVALLEEEIGHALFSRTTRRLELTEKGLFLFNQAQAILTIVDRTKKEARSSEELVGEITIAAAETPAMALVTDVLADFEHENPNVRIHLLSENAVDATNSLRIGKADFAVLILPTETEEFDYLTLPTRNRWGVLAKGDHFRGKEFVTPEDLAGMPLLIPRQKQIQNLLSGYLGFSFDRLQIIGTYNLLFNASLFVRRRGAALAIEGIVKAEAGLKFFPLKPDFYSDVGFAWVPERNERAIKDAFLKKLKVAIDQKDGSQKT